MGNDQSAGYNWGHTIESSSDRGDACRESDHGVFILFAKGKRPSREAITAFANNQPATTLSFDPLANSPLRLAEDERGHAWVELLRDGLTFDLEGLGDSQPCRLPNTSYRFDFGEDQPLAVYEAVRLTPGSHLSGGENTIPVIRCMMSLVRDLVRNFSEIDAIIWPPAQSVIGRRYFESTTTAWLDGGAFPALGLTSFRATGDGGLQSVGLDYLIGQELRIEPTLAREPIEATRLGTRLVNHLVMVGGLSSGETITAPDGTNLVMEPSQNGKFVRVWSG